MSVMKDKSDQTINKLTKFMTISFTISFMVNHYNLK